MSNLSNYNHKDLYESQIKPLVEEIQKICAVAEVPFMFSIAVANTEKDTEYIHEGLPAGGMNKRLTKDLFANYLLSMRGGQFVLPSKIDFDADQDYLASRFEEELKTKDEERDADTRTAGHASDDGDLNFL